jgi:DNA (cytosine-5)-methyltransferase 1
VKHGSLFSGIGGFDLASEWMGWTNLFHCEWMEFPRKVLDYYWPDADSHIDICKTDFKKYANQIDVLTGGFPCQPFSMAGKRKGTDDERYLWGEMLRAIQEIKPKFVIAENVFGITNIDGGLVFEQVCLDLEGEGYEVQPFIIPACAKNAPHRRDRVWFVAYRNNSRFQKARTKQQTAGVKQYRELDGNATNTDCDGFKQCNSEYEKHTGEGREYALNDFEQNVTDTKCIGWNEVRHDNGEFKKSQQTKCGKFQFSGANSTQSWWRNFPSQSPICSGDDGLPTELDGITFSKWRAESIKGYGNAIVPQVAFELFQVLQEIKNQNEL